MNIASDIATCMYDTGLDPITKKPVRVARAMHDRKQQRSLTQFFQPENWFADRESPIKAGRADLMSNGCDRLIPDQPPKAAIEARRRRANDANHYHAVGNSAKSAKPHERASPSQDYRSGRKMQKRRPRRRQGGRFAAFLVRIQMVDFDNRSLK